MLSKIVTRWVLPLLQMNSFNHDVRGIIRTTEKNKTETTDFHLKFSQSWANSK